MAHLVLPSLAERAELAFVHVLQDGPGEP